VGLSLSEDVQDRSEGERHMSQNSERWQHYPYLVERVAELNALAVKYGDFRAGRLSGV
jgi:hypothetical protein